MQGFLQSDSFIVLWSLMTTAWWLSQMQISKNTIRHFMLNCFQMCLECVHTVTVFILLAPVVSLWYQLFTGDSENILFCHVDLFRASLSSCHYKKRFFLPLFRAEIKRKKYRVWQYRNKETLVIGKAGVKSDYCWIDQKSLLFYFLYSRMHYWLLVWLQRKKEKKKVCHLPNNPP